MRDDVSIPFQLGRPALRGRLVRLGPAVDSVLRRHDYPASVSGLLGELLTLCAMLGDALKFEGVFSLQVRGDGLVPLLFADITHEGRLRGYARVAEGGMSDDAATSAQLLGDGVLALTVDQADQKEPYQGIVELRPGGLVDSMLGYFRNSAQIPTGLVLHVAPVAQDGGVAWRAGGLLLQRMPTEQRHSVEGPVEDWRRAMLLMGSVTPEELVDPGLAPERLLYRLFHEEEPRVFKDHELRFGCRCSRTRVARMLASFPDGERADLRGEAGVVEVTCQFCSTAYHFDDVDLAALSRGAL